MFPGCPGYGAGASEVHGGSGSVAGSSSRPASRIAVIGRQRPQMNFPLNQVRSASWKVMFMSAKASAACRPFRPSCCATVPAT